MGESVNRSSYSLNDMDPSCTESHSSRLASSKAPGSGEGLTDFRFRKGGTGGVSMAEVVQRQDYGENERIERRNLECEEMGST